MRTLNDDVRDLGALLGSVIREQAGDAAFELIESLRTTLIERRKSGEATDDVQQRLRTLSPSDLELVTRAFGLYFNLTNLAEEHERLRKRSDKNTMSKQTFDEAMQRLKAAGRSADDVEEIVRTTPLLLTFTAHPTEMRRRTVRGHLAALAMALTTAESADDDDDVAAAWAEIGGRVEALWSTAELRERSPTVTDEVSSALAAIAVLDEAIVAIDRDLRGAFERHYGRTLKAPLPLGVHSWVGGDRDGNPFVTADVTSDTLARHRITADDHLRRDLKDLYAACSQHTRLLGGPDKQVGEPQEPFRRTLAHAIEHLHDDPTFDVDNAITELTGALEQAGQTRTKHALTAAIRARASVFGRRLAKLDIREHAHKIGGAVAWLFSQAGDDGYSGRDEAARRALLLATLDAEAPVVGDGTLMMRGSHIGRVNRASIGAVPDDVVAVIAPLQILRASPDGRHGTRYVISMTDDASDVLEVLVLAKETGVRVLPVPLFETLADLEAAPRIVDDVLRMPAYRAVLGDDVQEIMLGYSDSNKDAGPVAATRGLYVAQREVAAVCRAHGVRFRFFHGRGTSLGRGGGPLARAILGQPPGTIDAGLRITEQGEALADKYGHPALARRNIEQGMFGLLVAAGAPEPMVDTSFKEAMKEAADVAATAYRALVDDGDFLRFFSAVTPIEEIARLKVASRPVRRAGAPTLQNLRAIPWVMSWTQNRCNLPGWFSVDAALSHLGVTTSRHMLAEWPAFRSMLDTVSMSLAKSDDVILRAYLDLDDGRSHLGARLLDARAHTIALIEDIYEAPLLSHEPRLLTSIALRNPYIEPIHRAQVELLRRSRSHEHAHDPVEDRALLSTILGIAAGVRNAG